MAEYDLHHNIKVTNTIEPQTITVNKFGSAIDMSGFESLEYVIVAGVIADGNYEFVLEQADNNTFTINSEVVNADLVLGQPDDYIATSDSFISRVGSIGKRRYQRMKIVATGTSSGATIGVIAVQGNPITSPVAEQGN